MLCSMRISIGIFDNNDIDSWLVCIRVMDVCSRLLSRRVLSFFVVQGRKEFDIRQLWHGQNKTRNLEFDFLRE